MTRSAGCVESARVGACNNGRQARCACGFARPWPVLPAPRRLQEGLFYLIMLGEHATCMIARGPAGRRAARLQDREVVPAPFPLANQTPRLPIYRFLVASRPSWDGARSIEHGARQRDMGYTARWPGSSFQVRPGWLRTMSHCSALTLRLISSRFLPIATAVRRR